MEVRNTGPRAGAEIVQVYADAGADGPPGRPVRELKAYGKVFLQPGEKKTVAMNVHPADLAAWDPGAHRWMLATGGCSFEAGDSSRNLTLRVVVSL